MPLKPPVARCIPCPRSLPSTPNEVEVAPDMIVHPVTHPEVQELVANRLAERVMGALTGPGSR